MRNSLERVAALFPFVIGAALLAADRAPGVAWPLVVLGAALASVILASRTTRARPDEER